MLQSYWSDPTWRALRITHFVTAAITLIFLAIVLLGATSFRLPLGAAIILNIVILVCVMTRGYKLQNLQRPLPKL
jgi:hypothetical protein